MPLDPFSALSVATALVQFIDFTARIVSKGHHLSQSTSGILAENESIELATIRLRDLAIPLQPQSPDGGSNTDDGALKAICKECVGIAAQLLAQLEKLKVSNDCTNRRWKSFRQALKSVWSKDKVEDLHKRLRGLGEDLRTHVLILLRYQTHLMIIFAFALTDSCSESKFEVLVRDKTVPFLHLAISCMQPPNSLHRIKRCITKKLWIF